MMLICHGVIHEVLTKSDIVILLNMRGHQNVRNFIDHLHGFLLAKEHYHFLHDVIDKQENVPMDYLLVLEILDCLVDEVCLGTNKILDIFDGLLVEHVCLCHCF